MTKKILLWAAMGLVLALSFSTAVFAQGVIIPHPCDRIRPCRKPLPRPVRVPRSIPIKSINFDTKIKDQVATTTVVQVFKNDLPYVLEGTYFFPIPSDASISKFAIWENGKKLVGEIRSRKEARRIYDRIVRSMKDPGLLEYAGDDLFQASIFPIPANGEKKLELTYTQVLKAESGTVSYKYPLGRGKNIWARRRPELPGARPVQKIGEIVGSVEIDSKTALRNVYSPTHKVSKTKNGDKKMSLSFETKKDPSDFKLFYTKSNDDIGMSLMTYREPGQDGFFLMMLSPKDDIDERDIAPKDIIFVLDTSGSMASAGKLDKAKGALEFGLSSLRSRDRFNIISFEGREKLMETGVVEANSSNKKQGLDFIKDLRANGGTNINDALQAALKQFDTSSRPKMVVFLTDGRPTIGTTNIDKIIENARKVDVNGLRLFPFGVGYDVNTRLLDKLGRENGGVADYVEPKEDLEIKVSNFFSKVNSPVLTDVKIDYGKLREDLIYPKKQTDIFRGTELTLVGRYKNSSDLENISFVLTGKAGLRTREFRYNNLSFPMRATKNEFLPRIWATRRVGVLMEEIRSNGASKELKDEVIRLGTRYGIVTPYTSFLAKEDGVRFESRPSPARKAKATGAAAVQMSKRQNTQQNNISVAADEDELNSVVSADGRRLVERVGSKTYYLKDGIWKDSSITDDTSLPVKEIKFGSDQYFELIRKKPRIASHLSVGTKVDLIWEGVLYKIRE